MTLLSNPVSSNIRAEIKYPRCSSSCYENTSRGFRLDRNRDFQKQFFPIYQRRFDALKTRVEETVRSRLGKAVVIKRLNDLAASMETEDKDICVIGTLFKDQRFKPNILQEFSEGGSENAETRADYVSEEDELIMEDDVQRVKLRGNVEVKKLLTGIVCGIYGREMEGGKFDVKEIYFASHLDQIPRTLESPSRYIAFLSGLHLQEFSAESLSSLQLAVDWLVGDAGEMEDQEKNSLIERVILAGDSLSGDTKDQEYLKVAKYLMKDYKAHSIRAVTLLDDILTQLAKSINVDIMPGANDPTNFSLPQQPLHKCLFPKSSSYATLHTVSNPYSFNMTDVSILGTSGQNVQDVIRNTGLKDPLDVLSFLLNVSHLAPSSPDTLGCFPYQDKDPFIIETLPHVFFVGNQDSFGERFYRSTSGATLLLSIPKFSCTGKLILLNLKNLCTEEIRF